MNATAGSSARRDRKDLLAFDRWDYLLLAAVLGGVALQSGAVLLVQPLLGWWRGGALVVPYTSPVVVPQLDAVGVEYGAGQYELQLSEPTAAQRLLDLAPGVLLLVVVLLACWLVLRVMQDIRGGEPFARRNITRLRLLAALACSVPIASIVGNMVNVVILGEVDLGALPAGATFEIPWLPVVVGGCVFLLAEAFRAGSRLRDDVDGLV